MVAAALMDTWESVDGFNPTSLSDLKTVFNVELSPADVVAGYQGLAYTGKALAEGKALLVEGSRVETSKGLAYRFYPYIESADGARSIAGAGVDIFLELIKSGLVLDQPAELEITVEVYAIKSWGVVANSP